MATPKTIISSVPFQDPQGNILANGYLTLDLSQPAVISSGGGQVAPMRVSITLTAAGVIPTSPPTLLWANDQLTPSGTGYYVRIYNSNNLLVSTPGVWIIQGVSPIDVSQLTPTSLGPSYPSLLTGAFNRLFATGGTPLVAGDFLLTGWGTGATISSIRGTDTCFVIIVTAGTTPTISPTIVLTYHDGAWPFAPLSMAQMISGSGMVSDINTATSTTQLTMTYDGLPVATKTYAIYALSIGGPN